MKDAGPWGTASFCVNGKSTYSIVSDEPLDEMALIIARLAGVSLTGCVAVLK